MVVVGVEAGLFDVERLGAIDVGDGDGDELDAEIHVSVSFPSLRPAVREVVRQA
jgi:hypothetical protein